MNRNSVRMYFDARSQNESYARLAVAAFLSNMNPTLEELEDVKTAVSEAVTNAIVHAYDNKEKQVELICLQEDNLLTVKVIDRGIGIEDVEKAKEPFYTTKEGLERSGMGFSFMEAFMDEVMVESQINKGTCVCMKKRIGK